MTSPDALPFRLRVGTATVELASNDHDLREWLGERFADLARSSDASGPGDTEVADHFCRLDRTEGGALFEIDGHAGYESVHLANVVDHFVSWCNRLAIESRPHHLNLHAAAVVQPGGQRCIVLPGAPGAGKSSVSCAAMRAGWAYLSDELVSIAPDGLADTYPKPITIKAGTKDVLAMDLARQTLSERQMRWYLRPADLGGSTAATVQPYGLVFSVYDADQPTSLEPMTATEATVELAANSQDELDDRGDRLLQLAHLAATSVCARLTQRDLDEAVAAIASLDDIRPVPANPPALLTPPVAVGALAGPRIADGVVAVSLPDGVAVHHPHTDALVALDPLAGVIWQLLDGGATESELAGELAAAFDHPPDTVAADLRALLDELDSRGLVATLAN